jgi:hypothetical protein
MHKASTSISGRHSLEASPQLTPPRKRDNTGLQRLVVVQNGSVSSHLGIISVQVPLATSHWHRCGSQLDSDLERPRNRTAVILRALSSFE